MNRDKSACDKVSKDLIRTLKPCKGSQPFQKMYEIEDFIGDSKLIVNEYLCILCNGVYNDPYLTSCGHIFCKLCMIQQAESAGICPTDNSKINLEQIFSVKFIKDMLDKQRVYCKNRLKGCKWEGLVALMASHLSTICEYRLLQCENENCKFEAEKNLMEEHKMNCLFRDYVCEYCKQMFKVSVKENHENDCHMKIFECENNCGMQMTKAELMHHQKNICLETILKCPFEHAGCKKDFKRNEYDEHMKDYYIQHLTFLNEEILKMKNNSYSAYESSINIINSNTSNNEKELAKVIDQEAKETIHNHADKTQDINNASNHVEKNNNNIFYDLDNIDNQYTTDNLKNLNVMNIFDLDEIEQRGEKKDKKIIKNSNNDINAEQARLASSKNNTAINYTIGGIKQINNYEKDKEISIGEKDDFAYKNSCCNGNSGSEDKMSDNAYTGKTNSLNIKTPGQENQIPSKQSNESYYYGSNKNNNPIYNLDSESDHERKNEALSNKNNTTIKTRAAKDIEGIKEKRQNFKDSYNTNKKAKSKRRKQGKDEIFLSDDSSEYDDKNYADNDDNNKRENKSSRKVFSRRNRNVNKKINYKDSGESLISDSDSEANKKRSLKLKNNKSSLSCNNYKDKNAISANKAKLKNIDLSLNLIDNENEDEISHSISNINSNINSNVESKQSEDKSNKLVSMGKNQNLVSTKSENLLPYEKENNQNDQGVNFLNKKREISRIISDSEDQMIQENLTNTNRELAHESYAIKVSTNNNNQVIELENEKNKTKEKVQPIKNAQFDNSYEKEEKLKKSLMVNLEEPQEFCLQETSNSNSSSINNSIFDRLNISTDLEINENSVKNISPFKPLPEHKFAFINLSLLDKDAKWKITIKNKNTWVAVGVCLKEVVIKNNYKFTNSILNKVSDHSFWGVSSNGYSWNKTNPIENNKKIDSLKFSGEQNIIFTYDSVKMTLLVEVNKEKLVLTKVYGDENFSLVPCVVFTKTGDSATYLSL